MGFRFFLTSTFRLPVPGQLPTTTTPNSAIKRRLDFSSTREALSNFVRGPGRMFRWSRENAFVSLAKDAVPRVDEQSVDSKKELGEKCYE